MNQRIYLRSGSAVKFKLSEGIVHAVNGVSYDAGRQIHRDCRRKRLRQNSQLLCLKQAALPYATLSGQILFRQQDGNIIDIAKLKPEGRDPRDPAADIAMIFQEP